MVNKYLYIAFEFDLISEDEYSKCESGIKKKIFWQINTFQKNGMNIEFINPYKKRDLLSRKIRRRLPFFLFTKWDNTEVFNQNIRGIYIRKPWRMDGDLILNLKKIKKRNPDCKIVLEVPTYPYDKEGNSIASLPLVMKDKFWRRFLYKYVDKIATYSNDDIIFNIPTIKMANAIDVNSIKIANYKKYDPLNIHIMLCATLCYWHGYDRAIKGLKTYYDKNGTVNFTLHVVGVGDEYSNYEKMINQFSLNKHIILHGKKSGKELDEIYEICDMGFDSMGRHRSGVTYNSSLKGKEYLAKGLPIVSGVKTELDNQTDFKYYFRVPANDNEIDFFEIEDILNNIYLNHNVKEIRQKIREYAENNFTYEKTLEELIEYMK